MRINALSKEQVLKNLATSEEGLSPAEARRRLEENGPNEIEKRRRTPLFSELLKQFTHFLAILLWIAAFFAFLSEILYPGQGMLNLGIAMLSVIFVNAIFSFIQQYRAEKAMQEMRKMLPFDVQVYRGRDKVKEVNARDIVPGDLIELSEGDKVPADARLIECNNLKVNNAPLTGESKPVLRRAAPDNAEHLTDSKNIVFAGTTVLGGDGKAVVFATGMRTEFGRIAGLTGSVTAGLSPLQKEIIRLTKIIAALAISVGITFFFIGYFIGRTFFQNFLFMIGVMAALVPEGLLPAVTLALAMGSQRLAKKKALMKTLTSVETLGSVTVICTDKTGTLTENKMAVTDTYDLSANGAEVSLAAVALLCNDAKEIDGALKGEPTDTALYSFGKKNAGDLKAKRLGEFPFDPDRKRMSTVEEIGEGRFVLVKGAPETVLPVCSGCPQGKEFGECKTEAQQAINSFMDRGLRVLAFAYKKIPDENMPSNENEAEKDLIFLGLVGLQDPVRPGVKEAIGKCRDSGIRIIMITGDSSRTARAVGREIGFGNDTEVIEGAGIGKMPDKDLLKALSADEVILSRMSPELKLRIVNILKDKGERVAVTGDGVNDAPALKRADIGIAMGVTGTDVAKEAADMVLLNDNFATIVEAIEEGKTIYENIRKFIVYLLTATVPELAPYLAYVLFPIPLPLTIMQVIAVDIITNLAPALALSAEPPTEEVIKKPPRSPKEKLLNFPLLARVYFFLGPIEVFVSLFGFFYVLKQAGWVYGQQMASYNPLYMTATTACLTGIVLAQVANVFACRTLKESVFKVPFFSNKLIFIGIGIALSLILLIDYTPFGNRVFSTHPMPFHDWLLLMPFAASLLAAEEIRKWISRKIKKAD